MGNNISVVVPVFNGERYIASALSGICSQTLQPSEIIVVNDGSTDRTGEILSGLDVANLKIIEQENTGVAIARNNGVLKSEGDILVFMDVDDFWHSQKLEIQINELNDRGFSLVYTDIVRVSEAETNTPEHNKIIEVGTLVTKTVPIENIIYKPHLTTSSVMVTREVYEEVGGFDGAFKTAEDQVFYMDVASDYKVGRIDLPLTYKRVVKNSLSSSVDTYHDSIRALDRFKEQHPRIASQHKAVIRKARARIYQSLGAELLYKREVSSSLRPLLLSMKGSPSKYSMTLLMKYFLFTILGKEKLKNNI